MSTATMERPTAAKLTAPRADAIRHLNAAMNRGGEIKTLRIRSGEDLDAARASKLEWVQECTELLNGLFDNESVADYVNDWVGKVFPEYAEFGNFVEQFYEEMDYRLNKLRMVLKRVEEAPDTSGVSSVSSSASNETVKSRKTQQPASPASPNTESAMPATGNKVLFVSQGPKDPSSEAVLQFMQQLSMAVVEADHTNGLIETLEGRNDMTFVVVMNVVDHVENGRGALSDSSIFKLGYCAGKLGIKRMCMMHSPNHPQVSDTQGIAHVPVDPNGGWQLQLARQMKRSGCDLDLNRLA